jgi:hypothetical protein
MDELAEDRLPADRLRWFDLALLNRYGLSELRPGVVREVALAELSGLYGNRLGILNALAPALLPRSEATGATLAERLRPDPFPETLPEEVRQMAREYAQVQYSGTLAEFRLGGRGCRALRELLASARQGGVRAALVLMPEGPAFRSWYPPHVWPEVQGWVERAAREERALVVNAREWIGEEAFTDSHHLLPGGARKFTERLGREYLLPWLRLVRSP